MLDIMRHILVLIFYIYAFTLLPNSCFCYNFCAREIAYSTIPFSDVLFQDDYDNSSLASNCTGERLLAFLLSSDDLAGA